VPAQAGNDHPTVIPTGVFKTADGYINIACAGQAIWQRLQTTLNDERLHATKYEDQDSRREHRDSLN